MHSSQGKTLKSAGWDFSTGGSSSTGTVRSVSVVKPPEARERKVEISPNQAPPKRTLESSSGSTDNLSNVSIQRDSGDQFIDEKQDHYREYVYITPSPDLLCMRFSYCLLV